MADMQGCAIGNKDVIQQLTDAWNRRDRDDFLSVHGERVLLHGSSDRTLTANEVWDNEQSFFRAFPDLTATTQSMLEEDGTVLVRWSVSGTHEGELAGIQPTGESATWAEWALYRLADGVVVEAWFVADHLSMLEQLGVVDLPG